MWIYIWMGVTILALIVEFTTSEMVSIWFAGGGIVGIVLSAFDLPWYITVPAFILVSSLLLVFFRKLVITKFNRGDHKLNADSLIGKETTLEEEIAFDKAGSVKMKGVVWTAVAEDNKITIKKGKVVKIIKIDGNKLIVKEVNL